LDCPVKARVSDMAACRACLGETLVDLPGVRATQAYAALAEGENTVALPV